MSDAESRFVLCVKDLDCEDLEIRKIYEVLADAEAEKENYLRIVDDSGEDYLYPAEYFFPVEISAELRQTLLRAA